MRTKKLIVSIFVIIAILSTTFMFANANTTGTTNVEVNNQLFLSNVTPVYDNGIVMASAKELSSTLGASFSYDNKKMTGTIKKGESELVFRLDDSIASFNGKYVQAPAPMKIIGFRFMVPVQFVSTKLGAEVYVNVNKNLTMIFLPENGNIVYKVKAGDSLWSISRVFGTSVSAIKLLNSLTVDSIYIGQRLIIKNYTPINASIPAQVLKSATLRIGPGLDFGIVGYIQALVNISVTGKVGDWYKVETPNGKGYIFNSLVGVKQDLVDSATNSTYFDKTIPVDTSMDYITYTNYTVQRGDTIWSIAGNNGIQDYELAVANNISASATLSIGQILKIPVHNIAVKSTLTQQAGEILDWFKQGQYVFPIGKTGKFIDQETGKSFMAKRTIGANHSDTETLSLQDSLAMKEIFGGSWTWNKRSFILEVEGRRFAISVQGMPHAGVDGVPFLKNVANRSGNFGYGPNYDKIPDNGMDGHFDVYFLNSLRHVDGKIDPANQYGVMVSGGLQ